MKLPVLLVLICLPFSLAAEDVVGILESGPTSAAGLPFLSANVVPHFRGIYEVGDGSVEIYFLEGRFTRFESWEASSCGIDGLVRLPAEEEEIYFFADEAGWSVFVSFVPAGTAGAALGNGACTFVLEFLRRLRFFLNAREEGPVPSFPAVLEFPD